MSKTPDAKSRLTGLLSISHDKDVDGLNAAAIVWRYAKAKGLKFDMILTDYGSFDQAFSKVAKRRHTLIVITDLGIDRLGVGLQQDIVKHFYRQRPRGRTVGHVDLSRAVNCRVVIA